MQVARRSSIGAWKPLAREAAARELHLRQEVAPTLVFETDPEKLVLIVTNLLSNAIAYSPAARRSGASRRRRRSARR